MIKIFKVKDGGLLTTVQDLGRYGYQKYGLSVSGAVDQYAHRMANILLRNDETEATLEITLMGLKLKVMEEAVIAITGGNLNPVLNDHPVQMWAAIKVHKGDVLHFKGGVTGCRAYLSVQGGIAVEKVLGSRATDLMSKIGGFKGRALKRGDIIQVNAQNELVKRSYGRRIPPKLIPDYPSEVLVRVVLGPQDDAFTNKGINTFFTSRYKVSLDSDRMACRLEGEMITHKQGADIRSEGMFIGAIQVPKNGLPIVFQAGRPSVGGYTKIGGVITVDQPKIAQLKPGDFIQFKKVSLEKAHELYRNEEELFNLLHMSF